MHFRLNYVDFPISSGNFLEHLSYYTMLINRYPYVSEDFIDNFLNLQDILKKGYMDSHSLEGNCTRRFFKSTKKLRDTY